MRLFKALSLFVFLTIFSVQFVPAQTFQIVDGDTINKKDASGKRQGKWIVTNKTKRLPGYKPDQKVEEGDYKSSRKTGLWIAYYSNGNKKNEINYKNGRPNGSYKTYYSNGIAQEEGTWLSNRNVGTFKRYYENGKPSQEFNFNETGKRDGKQKYFYDNGQVMIEGNWNGGQESGTLMEYYENGDTKAKKVFANGSLDEAKTENFKPKTPIKDALKEEEKEAPTRNVVAQKDEQPNHGHFDGNGRHKLYNKDKLIVKDGVFKNYRLIDGKWYKYNDDNILLNIERIRNGRYVGDVQFEEE